MKHVYHGPRMRGIQRFEPRPSTHKKPWVYAAKDPVFAAVFIGLTSNFVFDIRRHPEKKLPYLCERFAGALDESYSIERNSGSLYVLSGDGFIEGQTQWDEEVVCAEAVVPLEEQPLDDVKAYLLGLERQGRLLIDRYPNRGDWLPADDSDLVEIAAKWTQDFGERILEQFKKYHPHLLDRVLEKLNSRD